MRGRLVSLIVAIVLAAAPLARALCDVSCAEGAHHDDPAVHAHNAPDASGHGHHATMHESNTDLGKAIGGTPKVSGAKCCEAARQQALIAATKTGIEPPAIELTSFPVIEHQARHVSMVTTRSASPSVSPPSLRVPLRV